MLMEAVTGSISPQVLHNICVPLTIAWTKKKEPLYLVPFLLLLGPENSTFSPLPRNWFPVSLLTQSRTKWGINTFLYKDHITYEDMTL